MDDLLLASNLDDARAAEDLAGDHTAMRGTLHVLVDQLSRAVTGADAQLAGVARERLALWATERLVPHLEAEEAHLLPAVRTVTDGGPASAVVVRLHTAVRTAASDLATTTHPLEAVGAAHVLAALLAVHADTLDHDLVPLVARDARTPLTGPAEEVREVLRAPAPTGHACGCGGGGCGGSGAAPEATPTEAAPASAAPAADAASDARADTTADDRADLPVLDATVIPHAVRHATIFGALDAVEEGGGLVLVAPHDPLPLLTQIEGRHPGRFTVEYLQRGPETWHLAFTR
ncbi:DUF2249 domain-containing protein [Flavimobilis sp. GY10621]|uniref:DUF2249 domain-containing protein n=1 Tax=Flavimobilis rhizosphaerae TaxID=2775421 RepID=A0ABR9DPM7_9MICO|nr:DUF2249 domain-containing protein [Flavimobilis rhizosphaerae]MBD9698292.1 DUF2249 domain-containing protein [Flavimobilis rhizosphaerae]